MRPVFTDGRKGVLVFDCETWMIEDDKGYPPFVVAGFAIWDPKDKDICWIKGSITHRGELRIHTWSVAMETGWAKADGVPVADVFAALFDAASLVVNQRVMFDLLVLATNYPSLTDRIFKLLSASQVECTIQRERLLDNAQGILDFWVIPRSFGVIVIGEGKKQRTLYPNPNRLQGKRYSLQELSKVWLGLDLDKTTWRTGYRELHDVPYDQWPEGARDYVVADVHAAYDLYQFQKQRALDQALSTDGEIPGSPEQCQAEIALELMTLSGVMVDQSAVFKARESLKFYADIIDQGLRRHGLVREDSTRDTKLLQRVLEASEELVRQRTSNPDFTLPRTPKGKISTKASHLEAWATALGVSLPEDPEEAGEAAKAADTIEKAVPLVSWRITLNKMDTTYLSHMAAAGNKPLRGQYHVLQRTGRTSMYGPNLQNVPKAFGIRNCFIARPGTLLCSVDYNALELHTFAQVCMTWLGHSKLGDTLNAGMDPHTQFAAERILHLPYDEVEKGRKNPDHPQQALYDQRRTVAKMANFGLLGGLGAKSFASYCMAAGVMMNLLEAEHIVQSWKNQWDTAHYFRYINKLLRPDWFRGKTDAGEDEEEGGDVATVTLPNGGKVTRGRAWYTQACNFPFQGLAAAGAKYACFKLAEACYTSRGVLRGSRPLLFVHDEVIMEHPEGEASDRAYVQAKIMVDAMSEFLPDVRPKAEPALMRRWYKEAKEVKDAQGRLVPWEPKEAA